MGLRNILGKARRGEAQTFLGRLARDTGGNMIAIMAAALIPFCGLVGGGIDVSRMYITKTRLQHACDAGALAGRKRMGAGTWTANNNAANAAAQQFFDANFSDGSYGSTAMTRTFSESAGKVTGTASATVPMTLMRVLGKTTDTLTVTCDAEMRLPNTDIMFVLDTTGSMADTPTGDTQNKIASLRTSVKCFYEIVARLDTDATCTTGAPSGGTGNQVQIRFGFVPYATNVNVGRLLSPAFFADTRNYQTRKADTRTTTGTAYGTWVNGSTVRLVDESTTLTSSTAWVNHRTYSASRSSDCDADADDPVVYTGTEGAPYDQTETGSGTTRVVRWKTQTAAKREFKYQAVYNSRAATCTVQRRINYGTSIRTWERTDTRSSSPTTTQVFEDWDYGELPVTVGLLKNGTTWNDSFQWPIGPNGANKTINWEGCIEERRTVSQSSYSTMPADADDLDIDAIPSAGDANSLWGMALPDLIHTRRSTRATWTTDPVNDVTTDFPSDIYYACPEPARRLQTWSDANTFDDYVDTLEPEGNTYHDIGLIWGARLMSPTGIFAADNALTPQGGEIDRHMIFMTDGDACTGIDNYTAYGVNWFDRRTTGISSVPTDGCTTTGTLTQQVNARTEAICTAIKNKNITLWVISFGYVDPNTVTRLTNCATTGRYYSANNAATLQSTFAMIANQISQLRLTR